MTPISTLLNPDLPSDDAVADAGSGSGAASGTDFQAPGDPASAVLRCSSTADFLAALPFLTGFTAENSVFVVLFRGKQSSNAIRLNLPPQGSQVADSDLIDAISLILSETGLGPEGAAIVITSEQTFADAGGAPFRQFARLLRRRFRREGWPLRDLAVVAPDGWAGLLDPTAPKRGRALSEIGASSIAAQAREIVGEPVALDKLGELPGVVPERTAAVIGCLAELDRREAARKPTTAQPIGLPARLHGVARVAGACFEPSKTKPEARLCARLIRASEVSESWLVVLLASITRPEFIIELAEDIGPQQFTDMPIESAPDGDKELSFHQLLYSLAITSPEPTKLRHVIDVLSEVAANTPEPRRPGLLALLAWAWWMLGLQSVAFQLIEAALGIDPEHEVSLMVQRLIEAPPLWSTQEETWSR